MTFIFDRSQSPQLGCDDICQIWTWCLTGNQCFDDSEKLGKWLNGRNWLSDTQPGAVIQNGEISQDFVILNDGTRVGVTEPISPIPGTWSANGCHMISAIYQRNYTDRKRPGNGKPIAFSYTIPTRYIGMFFTGHTSVRLLRNASRQLMKLTAISIQDYSTRMPIVTDMTRLC